MRAIAEENEGLRKGLQEILNFLKDNSKFPYQIATLKQQITQSSINLLPFLR